MGVVLDGVGAGRGGAALEAAGDVGRGAPADAADLASNLYKRRGVGGAEADASNDEVIILAAGLVGGLDGGDAGAVRLGEVGDLALAELNALVGRGDGEGATGGLRGGGGQLAGDAASGGNVRHGAVNVTNGYLDVGDIGGAEAGAGDQQAGAEEGGLRRGEGGEARSDSEGDLSRDEAVVELAEAGNVVAGGDVARDGAAARDDASVRVGALRGRRGSAEDWCLRGDLEVGGAGGEQENSRRDGALNGEAEDGADLHSGGALTDDEGGGGLDEGLVGHGDGVTVDSEREAAGGQILDLEVVHLDRVAADAKTDNAVGQRRGVEVGDEGTINVQRGVAVGNVETPETLDAGD